MDNILKLIKEEEVKWVKLGQLGKFYGGLVGKSKNDFINGNKYYVPYKNVFNNLSVDMNYLEKVQVYDIEKQKKLEIGDIIFTGSSENLKEAGLSSVITEKIEEDIYLNSFCFFYRLNDKNILLPNFSKYLFRSSEIRKQIIKCTEGVTRYNVSKKSMENIKIPILSLELQEKIVKILDKYTDAYTKLQASLKNEIELRTKQYNYYRDMLLSQEYLLKKAKELCGKDAIVLTKTLGEIGKIKMCKRILKDQTSPIGDIPFYKIGTFGKKADSFISRDLFLEYKEKYNYPKTGEILISASGTIGRTVIFNGEDSYFQDSNIVWISYDEKEVLNKYLYHFYKIVKWNISEGGTIQRLYSYNLEKTKILIPPLQVQTHISSILYKYTSSYLQLQSTLSKEIEFRTKQYEYYRELLLNF